MPRKYKVQPVQTVQTSAYPREPDKRYLSFLLYVEYGSLSKTRAAWEQIAKGKGDIGESDRQKLGDPPVQSTLEAWCKQYRWVERRELFQVEKHEAMKQRTKDFMARKADTLAEILKISLDTMLTEYRKKTTVLSPSDVRQIWHMVQTEMKEATEQKQINMQLGVEQRPLSADEKEFAAEVNEILAERIRTGKIQALPDDDTEGQAFDR